MCDITSHAIAVDPVAKEQDSKNRCGVKERVARLVVMKKTRFTNHITLRRALDEVDSGKASGTGHSYTEREGFGAGHLEYLLRGQKSTATPHNV